MHELNNSPHQKRQQLGQEEIPQHQLQQHTALHDAKGHPKGPV